MASYPIHDAKTKDGKLVQIKATQGDGVVISERPEHLIVLKIHRDGDFEEVYNGLGDPLAFPLSLYLISRHVYNGIASGNQRVVN